MIVVFTGKPGAGKTYNVVERLLALPEKKYFVLHNVDGLREELIEFGQFIKPWAGIKNFLTYRVQEELQQEIREKYGRNMLVIIDEARIHGFGEKNNDLINWIAYHRHWGQEIWLIAQSSHNLHKDIVDKAAFEIRAKTIGFGGMHCLQYSRGGEVYKTERMKRKRVICEAYQSFEGEKARDESNNILIVAGVFIAVLVGLLFYFFNYGVPGLFGGEKPVAQATTLPKSETLSKVIPKFDGKEKKVPPKKKEASGPVCEKGFSFAGVMGNHVMIEDVETGKIWNLKDLHPNLEGIKVWRTGCAVKENGKETRYLKQMARSSVGGPAPRRDDPEP